jgi:hypothetical protein
VASSSRISLYTPQDSLVIIEAMSTAISIAI